jgi:hypothetical protein
MFPGFISNYFTFSFAQGLGKFTQSELPLDAQHHAIEATAYA